MNTIWSKMSCRKRQMWVYLVGALFIIDFVFYGYLPSQRRLRSLHSATTRQVHLIRTAAAQSRELPKLKLRLKNVEEVVDNYEAHVPAERALGKFLQEIARIMDQHNLADQVVVPQSEIACAGANCIPVHMNCRGSLKEVFGFFTDFQAMGRTVRIEKVTLKNDSEYSGQVSMHTEAVIFYHPQRQQTNSDLASDTSREGVRNDA
jgi:Tfp pilus assembly protein PilO